MNVIDCVWSMASVGSSVVCGCHESAKKSGSAQTGATCDLTSKRRPHQEKDGKEV